MVYLTVEHVLDLHALVLSRSGGSAGIRDHNGLESAVATPKMTFDKVDLYPTLAEKAAALGFSLIMNHPFVDGNKRVGHATMEVMLVLNGYETAAGVEIAADVDEQEAVVLAVASGEMERDTFTAWIQDHLVAHDGPNSPPAFKPRNYSIAASVPTGTVRIFGAGFDPTGTGQFSGLVEQAPAGRTQQSIKAGFVISIGVACLSHECLSRWP